MGEKKEKEKDTDKLSSVDIWKQVSQHLSDKKSEETSKNTIENLNFEHYRESVEEVTRIRSQETNGPGFGRSSVVDFLNPPDKFRNCELENSYKNKPIFSVLKGRKERGKTVKTPSFFPKSAPIMFSDPSFYKKFDLDTLFFIFYFFRGTVQQTYAAIRLKSFAWRFHLRYQIWFQRLDEPRLITAEYEKGEFLFFDYESTWNFMKKSDFVFEYCYLEHNDHY